MNAKYYTVQLVTQIIFVFNPKTKTKSLIKLSSKSIMYQYLSQKKAIIQLTPFVFFLIIKLYNLQLYLIQIMDYQFIQGISDIQQTQAMAGSRTTLPFSPRNFTQPLTNPLQNYLSNSSHISSQLYEHPEQQGPSYAQLRQYVQKTLNSWGLKIGYLPQNSQNKLTVNCLMQLISQKFNQQQNREQLKKTLSQTVFERNKYKSLLQQQRSSTVQQNKTIGRLQNSMNDMKSKSKQLQLSSKKQRQDDKKLIAMLKSKNQQIMHQIKKRQQEISRVKQQMKKNVGQKNAFKNVGFEVYEVLQKEPSDEMNDKLNILTQKYENERKNIMKQNLLLRQKIYDIREQIVKFAQWIDINIFQQKDTNYKNKLIINHNLLFRKQSLLQEFNQILSNARTGIKQIIDMHQNQMGLQFIKKSSKNEDVKMGTEIKGYVQNQSPNKQIKQSMDFKKSVRKTLLVNSKSTFNQVKKQKLKLPEPSQPKKQQNLQIQFQEQEQSQLSMISHVSGKDILTENNKFDKWDILFNNQ